jgi:hypothetical protein
MADEEKPDYEKIRQACDLKAESDEQNAVADHYGSQLKDANNQWRSIELATRDYSALAKLYERYKPALAQLERTYYQTAARANDKNSEAWRVMFDALPDVRRDSKEVEAQWRREVQQPMRENRPVPQGVEERINASESEIVDRIDKAFDKYCRTPTS